MKTPRRWMIAAINESTKPGILMPWHRVRRRETAGKVATQVTAVSVRA
ncbi:MAG: hypothetical protein KDE03_05660 [Rhodobacteraceae bacterium]|nr:hypothetical protein [Paracoccaceae bacterium]